MQEGKEKKRKDRKRQKEKTETKEKKEESARDSLLVTVFRCCAATATATASKHPKQKCQNPIEA